MNHQLASSSEPWYSEDSIQCSWFCSFSKFQHIFVLTAELITPKMISIKNFTIEKRRLMEKYFTNRQYFQQKTLLSLRKKPDSPRTPKNANGFVIHWFSNSFTSMTTGLIFLSRSQSKDLRLTERLFWKKLHLDPMNVLNVQKNQLLTFVLISFAISANVCVSIQK